MTGVQTCALPIYIDRRLTHKQQPNEENTSTTTTAAMANGNDNTSTAITLLSKPTTTTDNTTLPFTDLEIPNHPPFSNNKKKPPLYQICKKKKRIQQKPKNLHSICFSRSFVHSFSDFSCFSSWHG